MPDVYEFLSPKTPEERAAHYVIAIAEGLLQDRPSRSISVRVFVDSKLTEKQCQLFATAAIQRYVNRKTVETLALETISHSSAVLPPSSQKAVAIKDINRQSTAEHESAPTNKQRLQIPNPSSKFIIKNPF
jgi:hypothetical protein